MRFSAVKKFKYRLTFDKVTTETKVARFYGLRCVSRPILKYVDALFPDYGK